MPTTKEGLLEIRRLQIEVNRADMARAQTAVRLFQEFSADHQARRAADPRFTLAPAAELMVEHLQEGRLDLWRAKQVTDALREDLDGHAEAIARFSELMEPWFAAGPTPTGWSPRRSLRSATGCTTWSPRCSARRSMRSSSAGTGNAG